MFGVYILINTALYNFLCGILTTVAVFCNQNCTVDPTQNVLKRLETFGEAFSLRFGQAVGPDFVELGRQVSAYAL